MEEWTRPRYVPGGGDPFLMYFVFGGLPEGIACSRERHRTTGLPDGVRAWKKTRREHADWFEPWEGGYFGKQLAASGLQDAVRAAPEAIVIQGSVPDPSDLLYLRDCIGVVTALVESGGVAVCDPQILHWWTPADWRDTIFLPDAARPLRHAVILTSDEQEASDRTWYHTRGMRKFGRPDLSVREVPASFGPAVIDLCERFVEMQAFGAIVPDGQAVRMSSLPAGLVCRLAGDLDDPDFNNLHLQLTWPG